MPLGQPVAATDRLNNTFRPTVHNAFDPNQAPSLTGVVASIKSVEIDFWDDETAPAFGARPHSWFVRQQAERPGREFAVCPAVKGNER